MTALTPVNAARGCFMTRGLYLKANGELPCWDDVGESKILRKLDPAALREGREVGLSNFKELRHIRERFAMGEVPHPGLCETCAVRSAGPATDEIDEAVLQVLHVEPSYMCHLSCPQCIPQKLRKSIKNPPYHLDPKMYEAFLGQLRSEGIREIKLVIFEGRGDPLSCPDMEQLLQITKAYFRTSSTCITTHGSFPYKPWIATSDLDVIRFSVDGARQQNYEKYRIGGKLDKIFGFMEALKADRPASSKLYVEWKYILFEWNDSDEELGEAAELAKKLGVQLRFCRTHSPGRSQRYSSAREVAEMIRRVAPGALQDLTFQLKDEDDLADVDVVRGDQIRSLMMNAVRETQAGNEATACAAALEALRLDGMDRLPRSVCYEELERLITDNVRSLRLLVLAETLAGFFRMLQRGKIVSLLLRRCATLLPDTFERHHFEVEAAIEDALLARAKGDVEETVECLRKLLAPGISETRLLLLVGPALALGHPGMSAVMGNLLESEGEFATAILMFEQYLALAPQTSDWERVSRHLTELRRDRLIAAAHLHNRAGHSGYAGELIAEGALLEGIVVAERAPSLEDLVQQAASVGLLEHISTIAADALDFRVAYQAERLIRQWQASGRDAQGVI